MVPRRDFLASIVAPRCGSPAWLAPSRATSRSAAGQPARAGEMDRARTAGRPTTTSPHSPRFKSAASRSSRPSGRATPARSISALCGGLPAGRDRPSAECRPGAGLLRGEFPPGADLPPRRSRRLPDRLLRADRRGLALPQSGIPRPALPAPTRSRRRRPQTGSRGLSQQGGARSDVATRRTRSCPITIAAPSRTGRSTARSSKSAG